MIDFEEGWPWNFRTRDPNYPDAFEWKLNRGYTNSVGTGPKADRKVQKFYLSPLKLWYEPFIELLSPFMELMPTSIRRSQSTRMILVFFQLIRSKSIKKAVNLTVSNFTRYYLATLSVTCES